MSDNHRICQICHVEEKYCSDKLFFARFPLDENRCKQWVKLVGKEDLVHLPIEKLHDLRYVCGKHFAKRDFTKTKSRLKKRAVPKLGLTLPPLSDALLEGFPLHIARPRPIQADVLLCINHDHCYGQELLRSAQEPAVQTTQHADTSSATLGLVKCTDAASHLSHAPSTSMQPTATLTSRQPDVTSMLPNVTPSLSSLSKVQPGVNIEQLTTQPNNMIKVMGTKNTADNTIGQPGGSKQHVESNQPSQVEQPVLVESNDQSGQPVASTSKENNAPVTRKRKSTVDADATPRKRRLLRQLQSTKCKLASLKKSAKLIESLDSQVLKELINSALKNQKRKPQGKRYTTQQKISALAILKRSPKAYKYLQKLIPLPSVRTLQHVLKKIPLEPGICPSLLKYLTKISSERELKKRICVLCFDEMALKPRLWYNVATDKIEGFQDLGDCPEGRSEALADHALVFLLQGVYEKFKQPIAFYFVKGTIPSAKLSDLIKNIIQTVRATGFDILATVCDQGPTNMGALKILKENSVLSSDQEIQNSFLVDGKKVWIIYDVPHLFKSIRNNFLNGEIVFEGKKAKWVHLEKVEEKNRSLLYLSKISPTHVCPTYRAKMKVKFAAQILSNTVAAVLKLLAEAEPDVEQAREIKDTALVVQELDRLFDATNGPSCREEIKKGIRENVSTKTNHLQVWADYRRKLSTVKFIKNGRDSRSVRCINGYQVTLSSLQDLWHHVHDLGFKYLNLRQLNQDALENMFGLIRQHSPTNKNPTCSGFIGALKTAVVSGMTAPHSRGSNCQKDNKKLLTNFHSLIFENNEQSTEENLETQDAEQEKTNEDEQFPVLHLEDDAFQDIEDNLLSNVDKQAAVYVSGYISYILLKMRNECNICKNALVAKEDDVDNPIYSYIKLREWWPEHTSLTYPSIALCKLVDRAANVFENEMIPRLHEDNICQLAVTAFTASCDASWLTCEHREDVLSTIYTRLGRLLIRRQCARINQNISESEEALAATCKKAQQLGKAK